MKGTCTGTGRVQIRLSDGETEQMIQNNFRKQGVWIKLHEEKPNKNTEFSRPVNVDDGKIKYINKQQELASYKGSYHPKEFKQFEHR